jgi:ABC-type bacteriocin/lantibiotic exporter with double-glycine peptidase domain
MMSDKLFRACVYIGNQLGIKMVHPEPNVKLAPEQINRWMQVLSEYSRVAYRPVELKGKWWESVYEPFIVFQGNDWLPYVVTPKSNNGAELLAVESGERTAMNAMLAKSLQDTGYFFYEVLPERTRGVRDLLSVGFRSMKSHLYSIITLILFLSVLRLSIPISNQMFFDQVIPAGNTSLFWQLAFALILIKLTTFLLGIVQSFSMLRYRTIIENKMQAALWEKFFNLPVSISQKFQRGDLVQRMMLIDNIRPFLMGNALYVILEAPFSLIYLALMLYYSVPLGLVMTAVMLIFYAITSSIRIYLLPLLKQQLQMSADLNSFLIQMITGIAKLRMAAADNRAFRRWAAFFADYQQISLKIGVREIYFTLLSTLYPVISIALTYVLVVYYLNNSLSMGEFVGFQTAFMMLTGTVGGIIGLMTSYLAAMQTVKRTDELLTQPVAQIGKKHIITSLSGSINVDHLHFQYPGNQVPTLSDISFSCQPGEMIGLIGKSGSGKSTILRLLAALEFPTQGDIIYDGHPIEHLDYAALRRRMGVVLQSSTIFFGTVRDNIFVGRRATKAALLRALELSTFDEVLNDMPLGLNTMVAAGGGTLSGGEQQRLLLARALLIEIDILLLDEATSALDSLTQATIMKNLESLKVTRIVVAHRLETVRQASQILEIQGGSVKAMVVK